MNKHIELVKKWLNDSKSVTLAELKANRDSAYAADSAAFFADADADAARAARYAADEYATGAAYWVKRYEELSK